MWHLSHRSRLDQETRTAALIKNPQVQAMAEETKQEMQNDGNRLAGAASTAACTAAEAAPSSGGEKRQGSDEEMVGSGVWKMPKLSGDADIDMQTADGSLPAGPRSSSSLVGPATPDSQVVAVQSHGQADAAPPLAAWRKINTKYFTEAYERRLVIHYAPLVSWTKLEINVPMAETTWDDVKWYMRNEMGVPNGSFRCQEMSQGMHLARQFNVAHTSSNDMHVALVLTHP